MLNVINCTNFPNTGLKRPSVQMRKERLLASLYFHNTARYFDISLDPTFCSKETILWDYRAV